MLPFFQPIQKLIKSEKVAIDNVAFRLHYMVSVPMFIMFSIIVSAKQYFGEPINCQGDPSNPITPKILNDFCWVTGTFTSVNKSLSKMDSNALQIYYGVGPILRNVHEVRHHTYYQWVSFFIFGQAVLFYIPRLLWKKMEGGRVKYCTNHCDNLPPKDDNDGEKRKDLLIKHFKKFHRQNRVYSFKFFVCEWLNLADVILQIILVNDFLSGEFLDYGTNVFKEKWFPREGNNAMNYIFPKVTKCNFQKYGPAGEIFKMDIICVLALNTINEKVYLLMWVWMMFLLMATLLNIIYRVMVIMTPSIRSYVILQSVSRSQWKKIMICSTFELGDWFLLRQISKNVDEDTFVGLISYLSGEKELPLEDNKLQMTSTNETATSSGESINSVRETPADSPIKPETQQAMESQRNFPPQACSTTRPPASEPRHSVPNGVSHPMTSICEPRFTNQQAPADVYSKSMPSRGPIDDEAVPKGLYVSVPPTSEPRHWEPTRPSQPPEPTVHSLLLTQQPTAGLPSTLQPPNGPIDSRAVLEGPGVPGAQQLQPNNGPMSQNTPGHKPPNSNPTQQQVVETELLKPEINQPPGSQPPAPMTHPSETDAKDVAMGPTVPEVTDSQPASTETALSPTPTGSEPSYRKKSLSLNQASDHPLQNVIGC